MIDMEKVINDLSECVGHIHKHDYDQFPFIAKCKNTMTDAISLLKEQDAVEPKAIRMNAFGDPVYACGKCGHLITESMNYCHECGKRIKWEGR